MMNISKPERHDKGFSLIELIIVIAIMAILVGVLAPQFMKYVEKARNSVDINNAIEITEAIKVYCADDNGDAPRNAPDNISGITIYGEGDEESRIWSYGSNEFVSAALKNAGFDIDESTVAWGSQIIINNLRAKSKSGWTSYVIEMEFVNGVPTFKYTAYNKNGTTDAFKEAIEATGYSYVESP